MEREVGGGVSVLYKAVGMGDTAVAADMLYVLRDDGCDISTRVALDFVICFKEVAKEDAKLSLFMGFLYSVG